MLAENQPINVFSHNVSFSSANVVSQDSFSFPPPFSYYLSYLTFYKQSRFARFCFLGFFFFFFRPQSISFFYTVVAYIVTQLIFVFFFFKLMSLF